MHHATLQWITEGVMGLSVALSHPFPWTTLLLPSGSPFPTRDFQLLSPASPSVGCPQKFLLREATGRSHLILSINYLTILSSRGSLIVFSYIVIILMKYVSFKSLRKIMNVNIHPCKHLIKKYANLCFKCHSEVISQIKQNIRFFISLLCQIVGRFNVR